MTPHPMHEELYDALAAEAAGALDGDERERLLAHLAGCASCSAELEALRVSAALLAFSAPARPMEPARSARVRARLLARAAEDRDSVTQVAPAPPVSAEDRDSVTQIAPASPVAGGDADVTLVGAPPAPVITPRAAPVRTEPDVIPITAARRRPSILPWLAAAASLVLLVGAGLYAASLRERLSTAEARYATAERERVALERRVAEREATLAAVSAPASRVIEMAAARPAAPSARMFWDPATDRWTFFAHNLPAVAAGREYQLWLVTADQRKISAGTFRPDAGGAAVVQATYALPADALAAVAVTEEPAGGVPQPTGSIIIAGAAAAAE
jgi:anti-sigma-K factor RskA